MGKLILHEFAFNKVDGKSSDQNSLAYSKVTSCLTVTCICTDGTIAGCHIVLNPFSFWYDTSKLTTIISGKTITTVCVVGSSVWNNTGQLENLLKHGPDSDYYPDSRGGNIAYERKYLEEIIKSGGSTAGIEAAISSIFGSKSLSFFTGLYGGELNIEFVGKQDAATINIKGEEMDFPYQPPPTPAPKPSPKTAPKAEGESNDLSENKSTDNGN
ncbi:hypothetical protein KXD93_10780 [Mucilaginibacter sp. BJC16-A38]|uniref:hypothetical protein n=1 Tax=Mucilaginibacter phenanthrenivorans TaxID=1234842 RepID=UPI0021570CBC|nr:hypothetical protein [Mucilaginibacter phenanthrenivorans]MCR8558132.1 hypothetical protein [Mucilaginibacter phenanthrenivorans]